MIRSFVWGGLPPRRNDNSTRLLRAPRRSGIARSISKRSSPKPLKRPPAPSLTYAEWRKRAREKLAGADHHAREGMDAPVHHGKVANAPTEITLAGNCHMGLGATVA